MWPPASARLRMASVSAAWPEATASAPGMPERGVGGALEGGDPGLEHAPGSGS